MNSGAIFMTLGQYLQGQLRSNATNFPIPIFIYILLIISTTLIARKKLKI